MLNLHTVTDEKKFEIQRHLNELRSIYDIDIMFAVESGSRAYGFASVDSDYDVRFVYKYPIERYLELHQPNDVIEYKPTAEMDIVGWDIRKAVGLLYRRNPVLLEWLSSPIIYADENNSIELCGRTSAIFFEGRTGWDNHYLGLVRTIQKQLLKRPIAKYQLYILRALLAARWIRNRHTPPPIQLGELVETLVKDSVIIEQIKQLVSVKVAGTELSDSNIGVELSNYIEQLELDLVLDKALSLNISTTAELEAGPEGLKLLNEFVVGALRSLD